MMTLDNGATDGKSHSHTVLFRRVKCFEQSVHSLRVEAKSRILHGQSHVIFFVSFGSNHQLPRAIVDAAHRLCGVPEQVQDDLLQLDTIPCDMREVADEFSPQNHLVSL